MPSTIWLSRSPRPMKRTLEIYSSIRVRRQLLNLQPTATHKEKLRTLHTSAVRRGRKWIGSNDITNHRAPKINKEELQLDRRKRARLAQLRSGYCHLLAKTKNRLDPQLSDLCPHCGTAIEDVTHVFNCADHPLQCQLLDLWHKPKLVAAELQL